MVIALPAVIHEMCKLTLDGVAVGVHDDGVSETIESLLVRDKTARGWSYNKAAPQLETSPQAVHAWTKGDSVPERRRAPDLARFLGRTEQEIRAAMDESERERRARQDLQEQIDLMRAEQRAMNQRLDAVLDELRELLDRLPPAE